MDMIHCGIGHALTTGLFNDSDRGDQETERVVLGTALHFSYLSLRDNARTRPGEERTMAGSRSFSGRGEASRYLTARASLSSPRRRRGLRWRGSNSDKTKKDRRQWGFTRDRMSLARMRERQVAGVQHEPIHLDLLL